MPRILIVDDDSDMQTWLAMVLQAANYTVDVLSDDQGVERLLALGMIDLALIDHHLPTISGLTLLRNIRLSKNTTPVVMLTADSSQQLAAECFRAGAADFIAKPMDPDYLKIVVQRTLNAKSNTLKNAAYRALGYMNHKHDCQFHTDKKLCDCGLKDVCKEIQDF